ncbi:MAG: helix-turn-helix domain-containing protein [Nanoarchaeota archaeon]|nr:helix-turn-helix domain-containing protein [Nanoarchaeota archaeon]
MALTEKQRYELKKFIKKLEVFRRPHTELITVYMPAGYDLNKIINHLKQEQGTATNIKSASTRKNVTDGLERMVQHLRLFKKTPEHGLAVFSGNVAEREGQIDLEVWSIEPPVPLNTRIYRCDKQFVLDLLRDMLDTKEVYGLVVMDRRDANIALLKGKTIVPLVKTHSQVPGKQRAGGQCLVNESLIQLSDGSLPKIEIVHNPNIIKSVMIKNNFAVSDSNIIDKWNVKKNKIYKIITKNPRLEIQSSKDHLFFVATSEKIIEKPAEELKQGDYLIMPEKIYIKGKIQKINSKKYYNSFIITKEGQEFLKKRRLKKGLLQRQLAKEAGLTQTTISRYELGKSTACRMPLKRLCSKLNIDFDKFLKDYTNHYMYRNISLPNTLNKEFAQFLGYLIGDGCIETDRVTFFEQNKQLALTYQRKFNQFFKINSSYRFRESKNYHQIRFTSRPLVRLIKEEFPEIRKALDSEIPKKILQSDNGIVAAFLRGLFDADGYVASKRGIALGINNKKLAQHTQLALLRFSILSSLLEYDNKANKYSNNPRFTVDITEKKSIQLFKKHIGFSFHEKTNKLNTLLNKKSDSSYSRQIIVSGRKIRKLIEKSGYNLELFPKVNNFFRNERMMSKQTFKNSILSNIKDKKLYNQLEVIYNYPILPIKINKIEKINKKVKMIDISVKNKNFIANGIITHNSAARFARIREGAAKDHYKKVAEYMKNQFLTLKELKGIIVGGPGPTKYDFVEGGYITTELKNKIIAIKDLSYTEEFGLQELLDRSQDVLAKEEVAAEKEIMGKFFNLLSTKPGMVSYGLDEVKKNLEIGSVNILLLSESLDDNIIDEMEKLAKTFGTTVNIISTETREGVQLRELGKIAAILRYEV